MIDTSDVNWSLLRKLSHIVNWNRVKKTRRDLSYFKKYDLKIYRDKRRTRTAMIELYPDSVQDMKFLYYLVSNGKYPYEACFHNRDIFLDDKEPDENGNGGHKKGQRKKPHIHVVLCFPNARTNSAVAKEFNLNCHFVKMFSSRSEALCYLTHKYEGCFKYPYTLEDCYGTLGTEMSEELFKVQDKYERFDRVKRFIFENDTPIDIDDVYEFCKENYCLDVVRSQRGLLNDLIKAHDKKVYKSRRQTDYENQLLQEIETLKAENQRLNGFSPCVVSPFATRRNRLEEQLKVALINVENIKKDLDLLTKGKR